MNTAKTIQPQTLSRPKAAAYIGVNVRVFDTLELPSVVIGKRHRYRVATLDKYLKRVGQTPDDHLDLSRFKPPHEQLLYFIRCGCFIKIGITTNIVQRYRHINTANPFPVSVFMVGKGDRKLEQDFHEDFKELRVKGEWFKNHDPLTSFINKLYVDFIKTWDQ